MAFKRRRKGSVIWLPALNGTNAGLGLASSAALEGTCQVPRIGDLSASGSLTTIWALTNDFGTENNYQQDSIADFGGSGFRLRRIVGKLFIAMRQFTSNPETGTDTPAAYVTAGLIVLRTDDIGGPLLSASPSHYSPQLTPNERDPWIWRRSWLLSNGIANQSVGSGTLGHAFIDGPFNNYELAASSVDSAHVDQKTARRVGPEERVFLVVSAMNPIAQTFSHEGAIDFIFDYRMVATPMRVFGNRRNASR